MEDSKLDTLLQQSKRIKAGETNFCNSWENVENHRKDFQDCEDYPVLDGLNQAWQILEGYYNYGWPDAPIKRDDNVSRTPLGAFMYYVEAGFYPPPEIMLSIADAINVYLAHGGELSLENVFFGSEKKWTGNFAARKRKNDIYLHFHTHYHLATTGSKRQNSPIQSMEEFAEDFFTGIFSTGFKLDVDIDTFLRGYRRWKKSLTLQEELAGL